MPFYVGLSHFTTLLHGPHELALSTGPTACSGGSKHVHVKVIDDVMCRSKAGGELRVDAAEFVPGQWDKPKQASVASEMIANGSQHSLSGLTDEDSILQGSDANPAGWTAADYSQHYYIAQVSFAIFLFLLR